MFTCHKRCSQLVSEEVQHGCYGRGSQTRGNRHRTPQCTRHCSATEPFTVPLLYLPLYPALYPLLYPSLYLPLYRRCTCHCTCLTGCILSSVHPECESMVSVIYLELIQLQWGWQFLSTVSFRLKTEMSCHVMSIQWVKTSKLPRADDWCAARLWGTHHSGDGTVSSSGSSLHHTCNQSMTHRRTGAVWGCRAAIRSMTACNSC